MWRDIPKECLPRRQGMDRMTRNDNAIKHCLFQTLSVNDSTITFNLCNNGILFCSTLWHLNLYKIRLSDAKVKNLCTLFNSKSVQRLQNLKSLKQLAYGDVDEKGVKHLMVFNILSL